MGTRRLGRPRSFAGIIVKRNLAIGPPESPIFTYFRIGETGKYRVSMTIPGSLQFCRGRHGSDPESLSATSRISTASYKFGWLRGSRNFLIRKEFWWRGLQPSELFSAGF